MEGGAEQDFLNDNAEDNQDQNQYVLEGNKIIKKYFVIIFNQFELRNLTRILEVELTEDSKGEFSYKEVSDISDITEESYPEGMSQYGAGAKDLENYEKLMEQTKQRLKILEGIHSYSIRNCHFR